jgi:hypothetical protein
MINTAAPLERRKISKGETEQRIIAALQPVLRFISINWRKVRQDHGRQWLRKCKNHLAA